MQDFDLTNKNGYLNIEQRTDGGIGIYIECETLTLQLSKEELVSLAGWLITYLEMEKIK